MTCWANVKREVSTIEVSVSTISTQKCQCTMVNAAVFLYAEGLFILQVYNLPVQECKHLHFLHIVQPIKPMDKRF